ncbi:MAG: TRAP transporter TAXI family solute receptor [bacterium]|jgi:TRAP transporter TAXI family solute receptor
MKSLVVTAFSLFFFVTNAFSAGMGIVTGGQSGTYYQIGNDISRLLSRHNISLRVFSSRGSLDNVADVFKRPRVQMGIAQSDVLAYIKANSNNQELRRIAKKVKMVFPLYNEEVHLIGGKSIYQLSDLAGKRVAVGKFGSGTYLTAKLIFEITGIKAQLVEVSGYDAIQKVQNGSVDAMLYVAGYPAQLLRNLSNGLHLVPIYDKEVSAFYIPSTIPAYTYPWQATAVRTVSVKAVLITYDYRRSNCQKIGRIAKILNQNINWLKQNGHSKWKQVNFDFKLKKWEQYRCVVNALNRRNRDQNSQQQRNLDPTSRQRRNNVPSTDRQNNENRDRSGLKNTLRNMMQ